MKPFVYFLLLSYLLLFSFGVSAKDPDPKLASLLQQGAQALLIEADSRHNNFKDQTITVRMTLHGGADEGKSIEFESMTKGDDKRAFRFLAPAEMKGMGVIIRGKDEIYVRLPDMQKVRRVAAHAKRQSFQSSDWTFDDMGMIRLSNDFDAKLVDDKGDFVTLELNRKAGVDLMYKKLVIAIRKDQLLIEKIEYFDESGKKIKVQERAGLKEEPAGNWMYRTITLKDLTTGHSTVNEVLSVKVNSNLDDDTFSRRWLVRGL